jgi:hypothetical protein
MKSISGKLIAIATIFSIAVAVSSGVARADVIWNWSFDGQAGTLTTGGSAVGGTALAGTYTLIDFSVTTSAAGEQLGSVSGGQYSDSSGTLSTEPPYSLQWSGSAVTQFDQSGSNLANWWVIEDTSLAEYFLFGFGVSGLNSGEATLSLCTPCTSPLATGALTVEPVPAPLIGSGLPVVLAVGGVFFGAKLLERSEKRPQRG